MIENLYEQCVLNNKNNKGVVFFALSAISVICFAIALFCLVVGLRTDLLMILYGIPFVIPAFILWRKKDEAYSEYEYCFISGKIDIDKVINNKRRKTVVSFETSDLEVLGSVKSANFNRYYSMPDVKKIKAYFDLTEAETYFTLLSTKKGKVLLLFQPDETMLLSMKKYLKVRIEK